MDVHDETNSSKRSRTGGGGGAAGVVWEVAARVGIKEQQQRKDEDGGGADAGVSRIQASWPPQHSASRIIRVSRSSGGKDRHSKVLTAKGLRDRRVRLSVSTAIQFYDLQDRLGYDQPSKAVEWLIQAASSAIAELPSLDTPFGELLNLHAAGHGGKQQVQPSQEHVADEDAEQQHQYPSLSKSGSSSTSETSKGSVLSLSRSETREKAMERARERTEKDGLDDDHNVVHSSHNAAAALNSCLNSQSSFTELLSSGWGGAAAASARSHAAGPGRNPVQKHHMGQLPAAATTATADYFDQSGIFQQSQKAAHDPPPGFSLQGHYGNSSPMAAAAAMVPFTFATAVGGVDHPELQQLFQLPDHLVHVAPVAMPTAPAALGDYGLNFSLSPGLTGYNSRGTLQSNYPSQLPQQQLQRLSSQADGSSPSLFFGTNVAAAAAAAASPEFSQGLDGRLQLCYGGGDDYRHIDFKGKGKG